MSEMALRTSLIEDPGFDEDEAFDLVEEKAERVSASDDLELFLVQYYVVKTKQK